MRSVNKLFVVWMVVVILVFGGLSFLGFIYKDKVSKYKDYEETLVTESKKYLKDTSSYPKENEEVKISINKLVKLKYLDKEDIIDECKGYIKVFRKKTFEYEPHITCKYYKSRIN